jgi:hypothetical protein
MPEEKESMKKKGRRRRPYAEFFGCIIPAKGQSINKL